MPNSFKGAAGSSPEPCFTSPISPYTGTAPPDGAVPLQFDPAMAQARDPLNPCTISCPAESCCQPGGGGQNGGGGGDGQPRVLPG